jgi:BON domain
MTAVPRKANAEPPTGGWCLRALAAGLFLAVTAGAGPGPVETVPRDLRLTVAARRALGKDQALASLNLGVSVRGGVADLWGTVPTPALAERAVQRVREVQGMTAIRNELSVVPRSEAAEDVPKEASAASEGPPAGALAGLTGTPGPAPGLPSSQAPTPTKPPAPAGLDTAVSLGRPIAAPEAARAGPRPLAELGRPVALPNGPRPAVAPQDPAAAVDQLRRGDPRFRRLRPEVRGGVVTVRGAVRRGPDLMAFATAASRLPGVERVLLTPVQIDAGP